LRPGGVWPLGCGQSVPQRIRSGFAVMSAFENGAISAWSGREVRRPVGAGDLHVRAARFHQVDEIREARLLQPMRRDHAAEVIEHHGDRRVFHEIPDRRDHRGSGVDPDVPAAPTHPFDGHLGLGMSISVIRALQ